MLGPYHDTLEHKTPCNRQLSGLSWHRYYLHHVFSSYQGPRWEGRQAHGQTERLTSSEMFMCDETQEALIVCTKQKTGRYWSTDVVIFDPRWLCSVLYYWDWRMLKECWKTWNPSPKNKFCIPKHYLQKCPIISTSKYKKKRFIEKVPNIFLIYDWLDVLITCDGWHVCVKDSLSSPSCVSQLVASMTITSIPQSSCTCSPQ